MADMGGSGSNLHSVEDRLKVLRSARDEAKNPGKRKSSSREEEMVYLLTQVTESFNAANQARTEEHHMLAQRISTIEANVDNIRNDIKSLCKVVRDGNGQPSMVQRLANAEMTIQNNLSDIAEVKKYANSITASRMLSRSQIVTGLAGMIFTALLSGLALIATLLKG